MALAGMCAGFMVCAFVTAIFGIAVAAATAVDAMTDGNKAAAAMSAGVAAIASIGSAMGAFFCLCDRFEASLSARIGAWVRS